jgi:SAM-dependent methyltransferase
MASTSKDRSTEYALGHSSDELKRLIAQSDLIGRFTRRFFEEAGVADGMRVLDVGCGAGDVSLLARELVGAGGEVVGFDLSEKGISTASSRAASLGFQNVSFHVGDPSQAAFDRPFDAVIGRYVLMFQQDPGAMLLRLSKQVRSGGIVVFHEADCDDARSLPPVPIYDQCWRWVISALGEADTSLGTKFPAVFLKAGLPTPTMRLEALIGGGSESTKPIELVVGLISTLLPEIEKLGIASSAAIDITTLAGRVHQEAAQASSVLVGRSEIGAWCRV